MRRTRLALSLLASTRFAGAAWQGLKPRKSGRPSKQAQTSPFVIEGMEPRLLLSGTVHASAVLALHDNLHNLESLLDGVSHTGPLANPFGPISSNGGSASGVIADLRTTFERDVVQALQTEYTTLTTAPNTLQSTIDSGHLATDLQSLISAAIGTAPGDTVTVTDHSTTAQTSLSFDLSQSHSGSFDFNFGSVGAADGIKVADSTGNVLAASYNFGFTATVQNTIVDNPTPLQEHQAFSLSAASFTTGLAASATLAGHAVDVGILQFTVDASAAPIHAGATYQGTIHDIDGVTLAADAAAIQGGDLSSLMGTTPAIAVTVSGQTTATMDIPLDLTADNAIPGIAATSAPLHLLVTGHAGGTDQLVDDSGLVAGLRTATGDATFNIAGLNTFLPGDLAAEIGKIGAAIDQISGLSALGIPIPFTSGGLTVGTVIDVAAALKTLLVDPLSSTVGALGFAEGQSGAGGIIHGANTVSIAGLPQTIALQLQESHTAGTSVTVDKVAALEFAPTFTNAAGQTQDIQTVDDLATALNQAIAGSALAGFATASNNGGKIDFALATPAGSSNPATGITVTSPQGASLFSNLRSFGIQLATLLGLPGSGPGPVTTQAGDQLLGELGLGFSNGAVTFSIAHQFTLPSLSPSFAVNLDLGSVASLSLSNATLNLLPSVFLNLTVGLDLSPLGSDVNQAGGPGIGDGTHGTGNTMLTALPIVANAASSGLLTADQIALANHGAVTTGLADIQVIDRAGNVATLEIDPTWTLSRLEGAIATLFPTDTLGVTLGSAGRYAITIADSGTAYGGPGPTTAGLTTGVVATAALLVPGSTNHDYQAVLAGTANPTYAGAETKFLLTIGSLAPIVVDVAAGTTSAATFSAAVNAALARIDLTSEASLLGLAAGTVLHASDLVQASVDASGAASANGGIALSTTIYTALHAALGTDPRTVAQQAAAQWGIGVSRVDLTVSALNGSLLPGILGLTGQNSAAPGGSQSVIAGAALDGETLADRLELINTGISATIDVSLVPANGAPTATIGGSLGPLSFTGQIAPANAYVSLRASLLLDDPATPAANTVTLHQLDAAISTGQLASAFAFTLASGRDGQPFAKLDIGAITLSAAGINMTTASSPDVLITVDNPGALLTLSAPKPTVAITGYSPTIAAADVVGALRQVFIQLDSSLATTTIPLINLSLDQVLGFAGTVLGALNTAQADPAGTIAAVQTDLNATLGGQYVTISEDAAHNLIVSLAYAPASVQSKLPFDLSLSQLAAFTGSSLLATLAADVASVASASATGRIDITAGVSLSLTLGIKLGATIQPAALTDLLSSLNEGKGLRTGSAGQPDLLITLANGQSFGVDIGALAPTATVADLLGLLNTAAAAHGVSNFASYDATGALTLTDTTANNAAGLDTLGLSNAIASHTATLFQVTGGTAISDANAGLAYAFNVRIGGVTAEVDVAADATRTKAAELVRAIQTALDTTLIGVSALLAEGANVPGGAGTAAGTTASVALGELVQVSLATGSLLVLSASNRVLGPDGSGGVLNALGVAAAHPQSSLTIASANGSHIAEDLGLGSDFAHVSNGAGSRSLGGTLFEPGTASQRFFVETGTDAHGNLLTGIAATMGIAASGLNFTAALGPLVATITNGVAQFGADTGMAAAGSPGFAVGDPAGHPARFSVGLNAGFGSGGAASGMLTFADLARLGTSGHMPSDLLLTNANAAIGVNLPVQILGQNLGPIVLQIGNLFNSAALPVARSVSTQYPSLSGISVGSILNDPQSVIDGLDAFLSTLSGGTFAQDLYGLNLPLIGTALHGVGSFFSSLHNDVVGTLQSDLNAFIAAHPGQPATTQNIITQGLNAALQELGIPGTIYSYIDSVSNPTEISFVFSFSTTLFSQSVNLSTDLGIPGLGLNLQNGVATVAATLTATLAFGYKTGVGFFLYDIGTPHALTSFTPNNIGAAPTFDFATTHALDLGISVTLASNFTTTLSLGILTAVATNGTAMGGTRLAGDLIANIGPNETTGRLAFSSFGAQPILQAYLNATLNVDLALVTGIGSGSVASALPVISTEIVFSYGYARALIGDLPGGVANGVIVPLTFENVTLDLGSFLTDFLKPIIDDVEKVIGPLQPILDFLSAPLPGLSTIIGPTSILDLAQTFGGQSVQSAVHFIKVATEIADLAAELDSLSSAPGGLTLSFGTYVLGSLNAAQAADPAHNHSLSAGSIDPFSSAKAVSGAALTPTTAAQQAMFTSMAAAMLGSAPGGGAINTLAGDSGAGGKTLFSFPILHDPMAIIGLLTGQISPVDLVHVTLPTFNFAFTGSKSFYFLAGPVPVDVTFTASVGVSIALAFGFDTSGIIRFETSGNVADIFDGFYIDDTLGPQLTFSASFGVTAGIFAEFLEVGVGGGITGTIAFQLNDPTGTGKIHASLLLTELASNPLTLFDITGALSVDIFAYYWIGIDTFLAGKITLAEGHIDILGPITILSFSYDYAASHTDPVLATANGSTLALNIGVNADQQQNGGNIANPNQAFTITGDGSTDGNVSVTANGSTANYTGAATISADLGTGNNTVVFRNVNENVSIAGGNGNDVVNLGGVAGDPTVTLGNGNNLIYGAATDTNVTVGNGNNIIYAGTGRMTIHAGSGNNTIIGGSAADIVFVGDGNNLIEGGSAGNAITAGGGNNTIYGGEGANVISITGGAGNNIIFGSGGPAGTMISATTVSDGNTVNTGNATIIGGNGQDIIFGGGGNNTITGGAGNDVIFGAIGSVMRDATGALVLAADGSLVAGNNTITGGSGDTVIIGGAGANRIATGSGNDVVLANTGTVDGSAGGSNGGFTVAAQYGVGGNDVITAGVGNDVIVAGHGSNTITGGAGNDIIIGHEGIVVRTAADGRSAALLSATTTDIAGGGNDLIVAGTGSDVILAGAGSNVIHAGALNAGTGLYRGAGLDVLLGGLGTVTATAPSAGVGGVSQSWTVTGTDGAAAGAGNATITTDNTAIIMGGGGNNTITTAEGAHAVELVFGADGQAAFNTLLVGGITLQTAGTLPGEDAAGGNNRITVGQGDDEVFGGAGSNTIGTGSGADLIFGAVGTATRNAAGALISATDTSAIGGSNTITGGAGDSIIIGGAGANTIATGSGNDAVLGNTGSIDGAAGGSAAGFTVTAQVGSGGNDVITAGAGTDVIVAGHGSNTITGGTGNAIILGHEGTVVRTALGANAVLLSATTTDTAGGGNATIVTGTGADVVLGGAGNTTIHAGALNAGNGLYQGAGTDVLLGGFGTVTAVGGVAAGVLRAFTVTGSDGAAAGHGNATITTDNTAIIMGGGGNNTITATEGASATDIVFGANGRVVFDTLLAGGIALHGAGTVAGEEKTGGNNRITLGEGSDAVFGGAGNSIIAVGNGNDVILGHLGIVNADRLAAPNPGGIAPDVTGFFLAQDGSALAATGDTITAGNGRDVIMGGAGSNTITAGSGNDVVFGAAGVVTRGLAGSTLLVAQTTEESLGGNNVITAGLGSLANDVIFGGAGHTMIAAGDGSNVILGHLGVVNLVNQTLAPLQRSFGTRPDVIGRTLPEIGAQVAGEPFPAGTLDTPLAHAGATITAGRGNNVIMGGAGNNTIIAGDGSNIVFGASGSVTRDGVTGATMFATTLEEQYGGNNRIAMGQGANVVFGGIGNNFITVGNRANVVFGHLGEMDMYVLTSLYTAAQRANGALPDLIGRTLPEIGNVSPSTVGGRAGLDGLIANTTSTIVAGNGNNIIMGGAGNNTIVAGLGLDIVFGASGAVTRSPGTLAPVYMETVEESRGGSNTINLGLRSTAGDIVFGGIGSNIIQVGNGNNIVLGHLGVVDLNNLTSATATQRDAGTLPDIWARIVPEVGNIAPVTAGGTARLNTLVTTGNDVILAGNGNNVIMGGGGSNTISTGAGVDVVFGAAGAVTRDARTYRVMYATTIEESLGGNDVLNIGNNARNNDTVFGGAGNDRIAVGDGSNVVLGHLGQVDLYAITGVGPAGPDILGRTIPVTGNISPVTSGPWGGLGSKLSTTGDIITAGRGNNIIEGGAGNNTIVAGNGNNVVFGASGAVTRNPSTLAEITATRTESGLGGTNTFLLGTGQNQVFIDPPPAASRNRSARDPSVPPSPTMHVVSGSQTLASGHGLQQLARALHAHLVSPPAPPRAPLAYVLDTASGQWIADADSGIEPLLIMQATTPELVLSVIRSAREPSAAAA